jgi:DNA-binding CsgD family transcriptional regulator
MKPRSTVLTQEERDVLILAAEHPGEKHLSNSEIAQRLGLSVNQVKTLVYETCVKLGAHNRGEAILFAMKRGELGVSELLSLDELAEIYSSVDPDALRRIAQLVRQGLEHGLVPGRDEEISLTHRRQDGILTNRERDALSLVAHGLTNKEIADTLCMSTSAVRAFLNRASTKLGARKRHDAVLLALKKGELSIDEIATLDEVIERLAPLGAEAIEKVAQLLDHKPGIEPTSTGT